MALRDFQTRTPVARLLREMRVRAGLKQSEVAYHLDVPQSFISKYEAGERRLEISEVQAICGVLNISLVEFATALENQHGDENARDSGIS